MPKKDIALKPVIAMIHPGGHQWGTPDPSDYGSPDFIMHQDIVYVTIGYRLHVLGKCILNANFSQLREIFPNFD